MRKKRLLMPKKIVVAQDCTHLKRIIEETVKRNGEKCNLNFIDVSKVADMNGLFQFSKFNGDISKWDVSKVADMSMMFYHSDFNGDISKWNVPLMTDLNKIFLFSALEDSGMVPGWYNMRKRFL